jgi:N-acetylmuramic acid 6-phosphate etherase
MPTPPRPAPVLNTESPSSAHPALDLYDSARLVAALADDQQQALAAVQAATPQIAAAVDAALPRLRAGGRLIYVGAGTSGRLGVLDSVELNPTFSWPRDRAIGLLAGGQEAMFAAVEGAEDDREQGGFDLQALLPTANDVVILLAASGATPYAMGALVAATAAGTLTIAIANNPGAPLAAGAQIGILLDTGPELISGSTRLKAGTAQKVTLNTLSSALMVRLHKVYGNLMVDVRATNAKLIKRALRLTMLASGGAEPEARAALGACGWRVKVAVVMLKGGLPVHQAEDRLDAAEGSVHGALGTSLADPPNKLPNNPPTA